MASRFEQIIEEIEDFLDECKYVPLSNTKIQVDKERIFDLLNDLRVKTPDEVKRYQKVISNKEAILADAREKADALLSEAKAQTDQMLSEHEIMQAAYAQARAVIEDANAKAQQIVDEATIEANSVKQAAMTYTDESLENLQNIIGHAIATAEAKYGSLIENLRASEAVINHDRSVLYPQVSLEADIAALSSDSVEINAGNVTQTSSSSASGADNASDVNII